MVQHCLKCAKCMGARSTGKRIMIRVIKVECYEFSPGTSLVDFFAKTNLPFSKI